MTDDDDDGDDNGYDDDKCLYCTRCFIYII